MGGEERRTRDGRPAPGTSPADGPETARTTWLENRWYALLAGLFVLAALILTFLR